MKLDDTNKNIQEQLKTMLVKRPAKTNPEKLNKLINDSKLDAMF